MLISWDINENTGLKSTNKMSNGKLQTDLFFFKLNKARKILHSNAEKKHMETNAGCNDRSEVFRNWRTAFEKIKPWEKKLKET